MNKINVSIFCDEIKNQKINNGLLGENENWDYTGICIVPTRNILPLATELNNLRCGNKQNYMLCNNNCPYHYKIKLKFIIKNITIIIILT